MNREQKAATIAVLVTEITGADAVFAVDYRGISVPQAAELRSKLRDVDATFRVVKNSLTERAADQAGADALKTMLQGPTALTFVRGDAAMAAKAIADYARIIQLLPFKGGLMDGASLDAEQVRAISRLPSRDVLYGQLVGVVASPVTGLVRSLSALIGGLAVALGQVREKKESGEIPAGEPPPAQPTAEAESPVAEATADAAATAVPSAAAAPAEEPAAIEDVPAAEIATAEPPATEASPAAETVPAEPAATGAAPPAEAEAAAAGAAAALEPSETVPPPEPDAPAEAEASGAAPPAESEAIGAAAAEATESDASGGATAETPADGPAAEVAATEATPAEDAEDSPVSDEAPAAEVPSEAPAAEVPSEAPAAGTKAEPEASPDPDDNQADASA